MAIQIIKRGVGRPRKEVPTKTLSMRIEVDLYEWLASNRGKKSINQYLNDIIRKEAGK